jgi:hypothetical protein
MRFFIYFFPHPWTEHVNRVLNFYDYNPASNVHHLWQVYGKNRTNYFSAAPRLMVFKIYMAATGQAVEVQR